MAAHVHQFPCLTDNYGILLHDPDTRRTAAVDAPDATAILAALEETGWALTDILVTHHHADHTQGLPELRERYPDVRVAGPAKEADKIGGLDVTLREGDRIAVGALEAGVLEVPGHTLGHIAYLFEGEGILFAGDTLFALGCGRPFEASPAVLHGSLTKLARLPGATAVYCGHEYTLSNARFALTVDGGNAALVERARAIERLRAAKAPTVPTTIALELATNPFLRAGEPAIRNALAMPDADPADVFAELRARKNRA